ncbi:GapR family DNA-binding domain-containing protein [Nitratireductor sp. StC3]|uniref:GapR family DNA-binding domain-containing protein n=1 Tax=Nitratireductor sp. StC3 TaxID=2126741 RepID=UPI000D0D66B3|nr:GapR family DNA-binding domain-containing protein [Nitratireductor sp. StC3]PSM18245.1 hypothetical protein C7T96_10275 [Nitratireductor sp. StC3]
MKADQFAQRQFKAFIDRVLRCREAEDAAKEDTKAVYAEMKAAGYDKAAAGALVREIRDADKNPEKFRDRNAMLDLYRDAYERASGMGEGSHAYARAGNGSTATQDQSAVDHDPATGEITESEIPRPVPTEDEEKAGEAVSLSPVSPAETNSAQVPQSSTASAEADAPCPAPGASATISDDEIPDFVKKPFARPARPLRPHCLNPGLCAGTGSKHCHSCTKALGELGEPA